MKITKDIQDAIESYLRDHGHTASSWALSRGWSKTTVTRWLSGASNSIRPKIWLEIEPLLRNYLQPYARIEPLTPEEQELLDALPFLNPAERVEVNRLLLRATLRAARSQEQNETLE